MVFHFTNCLFIHPVGAGIVGGICLIIIEVVYKKHQIKKQKRIELARHAADKWRGTIEVN